MLATNDSMDLKKGAIPMNCVKEMPVLSLADSKYLDMFRIQFSDAFIEDEYINLYIPLTFDCDAAFSINVCTDENDDFINLYLNLYPNTNEVELFVYYVGEEEHCFSIPLTVAQKEALFNRAESACKEETSKTLVEFLEDELKE